jgi:hypothetical protein
MKNILILSAILFAIPVFAQSTAQKPAAKTLSISTHLAKLATTGIGIETEYHGFGAIGIFGGGYWSGYNLLVSGTKLNGYSAVGGLKYYLAYDKNGLDSAYCAAEIRHVEQKTTDSTDKSLTYTKTGLILLFGKRFDFDMFFIDAAIGAGPVYVSKLSADDEYNKMNPVEMKKLRSSKGSIEPGMDLKLMAGIAF